MPTKKEKSQGKLKLKRVSNKVSPEGDDQSKAEATSVVALPSQTRAGSSVAGAPEENDKKSHRHDGKHHHAHSGKTHRHAGTGKRHSHHSKKHHSHSHSASVTSKDLGAHHDESHHHRHSVHKSVGAHQKDDASQAGPSDAVKKDGHTKTIDGHAKNLDGLDDASRIYMRKPVTAPAALNSLRKFYQPYDVLNDHQQPLFYAFDVSKYSWLSQQCPRCLPETFEFSCMLYNYKGLEMMGIDGDVGKNTKVSVYLLENGKELFAKIEQDPMETLKVSLDASNSTGQLLFKVIEVSGVVNYLWQKIFKIVSGDGHTTYGEVRQKWPNTSSNFPDWFAQGFTFGISFKMDFSIHMKSMMLAVGMLLYFGIYRALSYKTPKIVDPNEHHHHHHH